MPKECLPLIVSCLSYTWKQKIPPYDFSLAQNLEPPTKAGWCAKSGLVIVSALSNFENCAGSSLMGEEMERIPDPVTGAEMLRCCWRISILGPVW